jgi:hypothetical protein
MGAFAVPRIGLKRSLSFHVTLPKRVEPAMLANAFQECQSIAEMCYSRRPFLPVLAGIFPCGFGLFPKFSTPVEKTVENRQDRDDRIDAGAY